MSTLILERIEEKPPAVTGRVDSSASLATRSRGKPTLDELITGVWEGLCAQRIVCCPACGGAMEPRRLAGGGGAAGVCRDCGTRLS